MSKKLKAQIELEQLVPVDLGTLGFGVQNEEDTESKSDFQDAFDQRVDNIVQNQILYR